MEESNPSQPREKIMTYLHRSYSAALLHLKQGRLEQGTASLNHILHHEFMTDTDMENLKYSSLMSLANIHEQLHQPLQALAKYWEALQILAERSAVALRKGLLNIKQFNQQRCNSEFTILLKMVALAQRQGLLDQVIYLLKRAITLSPSIWREGLLLQLKGIYQRQNMTEALSDINHLIGNKKKLEQVLAENLLPQQRGQKSQQQSLVNTGSANTYAKKLILKVNLLQKQQHKLKYSCWDYLLTMMYVLLKCHANRGFNKKKYKRFEESKEWTTLLKEFHPLRTTIQIVLTEEEESQNKMELEEPIGQKYSTIVSDLANEILKAHFIKKKPRKTVNTLEELTRNPSLNSKDNKKQAVTQTKSIYASIGEYYKDIFTKNGFKRELLNFVKFLDEPKFNQILGKLSMCEPEPAQNKKDDEMDQEQEEKSAGANAQGKEGTKQKKTLKAKKYEKMAYHQKINIQLKTQYFQNATSLRFNNIYEAVENINSFLIYNKIQSQREQQFLLSNPFIRKSHQKNILKVVLAVDGFFSGLTNSSPSSPQESEHQLQFLEILMQKLDQLIEKEYKNKPFKQHQQNKKEKLISFIKKYYTPSILQTKQSLENSQIPLWKLQYYSHVCQQFVRLNHLYGFTKPSEVAYYRNLFIAFKKKVMPVGSQNEALIEKRLADTIDRQIEKAQKKISSKSSLLSMAEQSQEKQNPNIDEIFKISPELASVLPLLKYFNCFNTQPKVKGSQMAEEINSKVYLESFVKISEAFFKKVQSESCKEFNSRILFLIADIMKLRQVVADIYEKITYSSSFKITELEPSVFTPVLYHLLRFYLLNLYEENDNCIRIIFYISNIVFRSLPDAVRFTTIPKCIYLFDQLIKYKKFKPDLLTIVRKKFYHNLVVKNLFFIYQSPLLSFKETEATSKRKKQRKNSAKSSSEEPCQKQVEDLHDQNAQVRDKVYDILHDIYFCPEKEREFNPKKIEEAVGYFMYLLRAFHEEFYCQVVQLEYQVSKMIKRCYKIFTQKRWEVFDYCERFKNFKVLFDSVMSGDDSSKIKLISFITREQPICECCANLRDKYPFYVESLLVLGKYFQSQAQKDDVAIDKEQWLEELDKDENYYFEYLALNLDSQIAWENIIRVNANKSYIYFDSLTSQPKQTYKGKFLYTKRIIQLINDNLPQFRRIIEYGNQKSQILNVLKLKEREYYTMLKEMQAFNASKNSKEYKDHKDLFKKYSEGIKKVWNMQQKFVTDDIKIRYIRTIEIKMPLYWLNAEREPRLTQKSEVIQLDKEEEEEIDEMSGNTPPSKAIQKIAEILADIQFMINDLPAQEKTDYVQHLEEDLVVEAYRFLCTSIDYRLSKMLGWLGEAIKSQNEPNRKQATREAERNFNDLAYTLGFFQEKVLSTNQKYKIRVENIVCEANELKIYSSLFQGLFVKNPQNEGRGQARIKSIDKRREKKQIAIQKEEQKPKEEMIEEIPRKKSTDSENSKGGKNKEIQIDIAKYCVQKLKKQLKNNNNYKNLNKLKFLLLSVPFIENIQKTSKVIMELAKLYLQLPKFQTTKRYKNRRSVGNGLLQCSIIALKYANMPERASQILKDFYNLKTGQLITINTYNDKIATEKNQLLSEFYHRLIVNQIMRMKFVEHLLNIFEQQGNKQNVITLTRKLLRLSRGEIKHQKEKDKGKDKEKEKEKDKEKDKEKEKEKEKDKEKQEELGSKVVIVLDADEQMKDYGQIKEEKQVPRDKNPKQKKIVKQNKEKEEKEKEIRCYYLLYCTGTSTFVNILKNQSMNGPIDQKYEKNLLQFRNRIKRGVKKDEKNPYLAKIDEFITFYEEKYAKKIKLKRAPKKLKDGVPVIDQ